MTTVASKFAKVVRYRKFVFVIASVLAAVIGAKIGHPVKIKPFGLWDGPG